MPHQCTDCGRAFADGSKEMLSGCPNCGGNKFQFLPPGSDPDEPAADPPEPPEPPGENSSVSRTVGNAAAAVRDFVGSSDDPPESSPSTVEPSTSSSVTDSVTTTARPSDSADSSAGGTSASADSSTTDAPAPSPPSPTAAEDAAQADARSEVVGPDDLPPIPETERPPRSDSDGTGGVSARQEMAVQQPTTDPDETNPERASQTPESSASTESTDVAGESTTGVSEVGEAAETATAPKSASTDTPETESESSDQPDLAQLREELNEQFESIRVVAPGQYELNLMELYDREEYIIALQEDGRYTIQVPETWRD